MPRCATWAASLGAGGGEEEEGGDGEDPLGVKLSHLLCALAGEVMDSLKKVENGEEGREVPTQRYWVPTKQLDCSIIIVLMCSCVCVCVC